MSSSLPPHRPRRVPLSLAIVAFVGCGVAATSLRMLAGCSSDPPRDTTGTSGTAGSSGNPGDAGEVDGASALADAASPGLVFTATSSLDALALDGIESFRVAYDLENRGTIARTLTRSPLAFVSEGGYTMFVNDSVVDGKTFFGAPLALAAGGHAKGNLSFYWSTPVTHAHFRIDAVDATGATSTAILPVPIVRQGFAGPPAVPSDDAYVAVMGPLETVRLASGQSWLTIVGQVVATSRDTASVRKLRLVLKDSAGRTVDDRDVTSKVVLGGPKGLASFLDAFAVPESFVTGSVDAEVDVRVGTESRTLTRSFDVGRGVPTVLAPPLAGVASWANGQGETVLHTHFQYPEQRYAYDLVMFRDVGSARATHDGDATKNASYFVWGAPIRAVAAGTVVDVVDDVPDNDGTVTNAANSPMRNSKVIVEHADGGTKRWSMYAHVRKGSAKVKVGDVVRAGDVLAEVGNAGFSTEPHLHLAYYTLDASGRVRALPMAFPGLSPYVPPAADGGIDAATVDASDGAVDGAATDAATATVGVPHGRTEYTAP